MDALKKEIQSLLNGLVTIHEGLRKQIITEITITFSEGRLIEILEKIKKHADIEKGIVKRIQEKDPTFIGKIKYLKVKRIKEEIKKTEELNKKKENPEDILDELEALFN